MKRSILLGCAVVGIGGSIILLELQKPDRVNSQSTGIVPLVAPEKKASNYSPAKELVSVQEFINSAPFRISDLVGKKVILVDFWTYSCINCQRTLPYLNAWYEKYKDQGLEIIGIHTPEFEFEKKSDNVRAATQKFGIAYPVVQDNEYATWSAYQNRYWPRKYLIDIDGYVVYDHIGEGGYEETEQKIQELLAERKQRVGEVGTIPESFVAPDAEAVDTSRSRSPETYFGAWRNELFGNGHVGVVGVQALAVPDALQNDALYLGGVWNIQKEYAENQSGEAVIQYRFRGMSMNVVAESDADILVRVLQDGMPAQGDDMAPDGTLLIQKSGLYNIIRNTTYGEHTIEIIIKTPGVRVFAFTFG